MNSQDVFFIPFKLNLQIMALLEKKSLLVKKVNTTRCRARIVYQNGYCQRNSRIVEYKGKIVTWKEVEKMADDRNGYVFLFQ